jgi:hypothetical protein
MLGSRWDYMVFEYFVEVHCDSRGKHWFVGRSCLCLKISEVDNTPSASKLGQSTGSLREPEEAVSMQL